MNKILTRAAAQVLNALPPWAARFAPQPVLQQALSQLQEQEHRAIRLARVDLQLQEIRGALDALEQEAGR